jgi:hypothetical protein
MVGRADTLASGVDASQIYCGTVYVYRLHVIPITVLEEPSPYDNFKCTNNAWLPGGDCLLQPGKDVNAQHKTAWLWGLPVPTRRHVASLPGCAEHSFSTPILPTRMPNGCSITSTWSLTWRLMPSSSNGVV